MRSALALSSLALVLGACTPPQSYENPPLATKVDRLRIERDNCMLAKAPQFDDHGSNVRAVARRVAAACADETDRLMALAIPYPDDRARIGFQQEAERRAADIVMTFRGVDSRAEVPRPGEPAPLSR